MVFNLDGNECRGRVSLGEVGDERSVGRWENEGELCGEGVQRRLFCGEGDNHVRLLREELHY